MDQFLVVPKKMHLPSTEDLCSPTRKAGKGCSLYSMDVAGAYRQLFLDPINWSLVYFKFDSFFYVDISLPFGLTWAASHCQDVMSLVTRELIRQGSTILNYIDNFRGVACTYSQLSNISAGSNGSCHIQTYKMLPTRQLLLPLP